MSLNKLSWRGIANLFLQCTFGEPILGVKVALMHLKVKNTGTSTEELKTVQSHLCWCQYHTTLQYNDPAVHFDPCV
jgi:hypothetical protein